MTSVADTSSCTKCSAVLDTEGYPRWCRACRAKYKREYESTRKEMTESRGFSAGQTAMKDHLARIFAGYGPAGFTGTEIAGLIRNTRSITTAETD